MVIVGDQIAQFYPSATGLKLKNKWHVDLATLKKILQMDKYFPQTFSND